jgi:hypothetical protein
MILLRRWSLAVAASNVLRLRGTDLAWDETAKVTGSIRLMKGEAEEEEGIPGFL